MTKIVGIDSGKKPPKDPPNCPYCGKDPACPDFTCRRIASVSFEGDDCWTIDFVDPMPVGDEPPAA